MSKIVAWLLSLTKIGKIIEPIQKFLVGYKTYIAGAAIALPALLTIIQNFSEQGTAYLVGITATPEYLHLLNGIAIITGRAAIEKLV